MSYKRSEVDQTTVRHYSFFFIRVVSVFKFPILYTNKESDIEAGNVSVQNLRAGLYREFCLER